MFWMWKFCLCTGIQPRGRNRYRRQTKGNLVSGNLLFECCFAVCYRRTRVPGLACVPDCQANSLACTLMKDKCQLTLISYGQNRPKWPNRRSAVPTTYFKRLMTTVWLSRNTYDFLNNQAKMGRLMRNLRMV